MTDPLSIQIYNRQRFEQDEPGEWLKLPATAEQLQEAMRRVGITAENRQDFFINGIESPIAAVTRLSLENIQAAGVDELNYLAAAIQSRDSRQIDKLNAAIEVMTDRDNVHSLIELTQNTGVFDFHPDIFSNIQLGEHTFEHSGLIQIPDEWAAAIDLDKLGELAAENEKGTFTEYGYIVPNGLAWKSIMEIPQEYRIMSFPKPEQNRDDPSIDYDAISTRAPAVSTVRPPELAADPEPPQPVKVITLESEKPADKLKEITDKLESGIAGIFESEQYRDYLKTLSKFHDYSLNNTILIAMQKPDATHVAGFNTWKNAFERNVVKGQKGIKIIAPSPYNVKKEMEKIDPTTQRPVLGSDGKPVTEEVEIKIPAYRVVSVFDVSQTEGKELPTIGVDVLTGDVEQYKDFFAALEKTSPVPIAFENIEGGANGYYHQVDKRIAIDEGMSELQTLKTTIHEVAHARLHDIDAPEQDKQPRADKRTREVEAESVAYTVCQHYGLDTSDYSFAYVAGWSSGKELTELKASLETIRTTAAELITEIDGHFAELQKDREQTAEQDEQPPQATADTPVTYYSINEQGARRAKEMNSFYDYKPGSATAEYRQMVDKAAEIADWQKSRVDPMYHEKIDRLLDAYARKLAENMNHSYAIDSRVPSVMIAGPANFPVRKKEKQNAARDSNMREWQDIQGLLDKIRSTGMGGISADDPNAAQKLQEKLSGLEQSQENMKAANAYYRKNKTLDGCPNLTAEQIGQLKASMAKGYHLEGKPFASYSLSNNSAEISRVKARIAELTRRSEAVYAGWEFDGGKVEANTRDNRLQIFFDGKPDEATRAELKSNGFRWAPSAGAWQRQLNSNAFFACNYIKSIQPDTGEKPTDLQRKARQEAAAPIPQDTREQERAEPQQGDTFTIFQLKDGDETRYYRFEPLDRLQAAGLEVEPGNYNLVYTGQLAAGDTLDRIYERFNIDHPQDFTGHSLSVSDVVVLNRDGGETAHYVDSMGFQEVPQFLHQQARDFDMRQTADRLRRNAVQAESPIKAAEMSTEQNYNMIDGIPNNRPTVDELEARAKSGQQINLSDLAAAIKAEKKERDQDSGEKPSIRAQLKQAGADLDQREKSAPSRTRDKTPGLEV